VFQQNISASKEKYVDVFNILNSKYIWQSCADAPNYITHIVTWLSCVVILVQYWTIAFIIEMNTHFITHVPTDGE